MNNDASFNNIYKQFTKPSTVTSAEAEQQRPVQPTQQRPAQPTQQQRPVQPTQQQRPAQPTQQRPAQPTQQQRPVQPTQQQRPVQPTQQQHPVQPTQQQRPVQPTQQQHPVQPTQQQRPAQPTQQRSVQPKKETTAVKESSTSKPKKKKEKRKIQKEPVTYNGKSYVEVESQNGFGFGITGIGRMVDFDAEKRTYTLRLDENDISRMPLKLPNGRKNQDAENDVVSFSRVRVPTPLLEAVSDYWHSESGLEPNSKIPSPDLIVFLLFTQLPSNNARQVLKPLLSEKYKFFGDLIEAFENADTSSSEANLMQSMIDKLDSIDNRTSTLLTGLHRIQDTQRNSDVLTHGVSRGLAFLLAYQFGWYNHKDFPRSSEDAEGILNQDSIIRALNSMYAVAPDEAERFKTIQNDRKRKGLK